MLNPTIALMALLMPTMFDEAPEVPLWPGGAPGFESRKDEPIQAKDYWVKNIHNPSITVFLPPKEKATGASMVVCPGGGHRELVFKAEGVEAATYLNSIGVAAFVLKYRLGREPNSPYMPLEKFAGEDGRRAIRLVRSRAEEWGLDPARVGLMGFSAGGEVASMVTFGETAGKSDAPDPIDRLSSPPRLPGRDLFRTGGHPRNHPQGCSSRLPPRRQRRPRRIASHRQPVPEIPGRRGSRRSPHPRQRGPRLQHGESVEAPVGAFLAGPADRLARR